MFQGGVELNWLPPSEPNGEVHFAASFSSETVKQLQTSCGPRHCNVTGLQEGVVYTIDVLAFNRAATSRVTRSAALTYKHTLDAANSTSMGEWVLGMCSCMYSMHTCVVSSHAANSTSMGEWVLGVCSCIDLYAYMCGVLGCIMYACICMTGE